MPCITGTYYVMILDSSAGDCWVSRLDVGCGWWAEGWLNPRAQPRRLPIASYPCQSGWRWLMDDLLGPLPLHSGPASSVGVDSLTCSPLADDIIHDASP